MAVYKSIRRLICDGKVYHLTPRPDGSFHDAIQSYDEATDRSVIFVHRQETDSDSDPRGLRRDRLYQVHSRDDSRMYTATGEEIMGSGVTVALPQQFSAEILYLDPAR